jgi:glycosidase
MKNRKDPSDGMVRLDFSGGWEGDKENKFISSGRSSKENEMFNYIKTLANYRKSSSALATGKTMQYIPQNGLYVYFRYDRNATIMVVSNTSDKSADVKIDRFRERTNGFTKMKNIISGEVTGLKDFSTDAKAVNVYELVK